MKQPPVPLPFCPRCGGVGVYLVAVGWARQRLWLVDCGCRPTAAGQGAEVEEMYREIGGEGGGA